MAGAKKDSSVVGTFDNPAYADRAADAARRAGFHVERRSDGAVLVDPGANPQHVGEIEGILGAFGAREFSRGSLESTSDTDVSGTASEHDRQLRTRAEDGARVELVEEQLQPRTRSVQTGEVTIRKEVVTETRTIEVPVRREELVIEHHSVEHEPMGEAELRQQDPLVQQLIERLRHMREGESLRIPIIEEEVIVSKRPVVVEEITLGKRTLEETQKVSDTVRREQAHVEKHGDVRIRDE